MKGYFAKILASVRLASVFGTGEDMKTIMRTTILFLCTGNYYRSRYAEAMFNHLAYAGGLINHVAISRGLKIDQTELINPGPVSRHTAAATLARGVPLEHRMPLPLIEEDLHQASMVVALKEAEHRQMLEASFPGWGDRAVFWHVHDLDCAGPDVALAEVEEAVRRLIADLKTVAGQNVATQNGTPAVCLDKVY